MKRISLIFALLFFVIAVNAQTKTVTGIVSSSEDNAPLANVTVQLKGKTSGVITDSGGRYSLVANNEDILQFVYVGYATAEQAVGSDTLINITLVPAESGSNDVVVTAEFGMKRLSRAMGSSAQTIKATDITESGRDNFITALQGKISGLNVSLTSGAPGASTNVTLRSLTSISGNNQPLYVVDGVPMNNSTFNPLATARGLTERFGVNNLDFSSRGNDFNPEDIESVTVLKGAAAAVLYGSDASNGAIVITTKKGRPGKGRVSYDNSFRWDKAYGYPQMQDKYANGYYGTTNYYYLNKFGGLYPDTMQLYDNLAAVTQVGLTQRHNVSFDAGNDKSTVRLSAGFLDQTGIIRNTDANRINLGLSGQSQVTPWLKFDASMQYVKSSNNKTRRGTDGPLYRAMLWPLVDDMSVYETPDGHMKTPEYYLDGDLLNPLYDLNKNKFYDKSDRFLMNVGTTITPVKNTFVRAQIGYDVGTQTFIQSLHPYYAAYNGGIGEYFLTNSNFSQPTLNILTGYNNTFFNDKFSIGAQIGYHQLENGVTQLVTSGGKVIIPDFQSINNVDPASVVSNQTNTKRRIQAISGQFEFGWNNMAFITLRGRNDWSSTLPVNNNSYFYPAIEGSFIVTDIAGLNHIKALNFFKIRGAIAQVGKDAPPLSISPQLQPTNLTGGGFKYGFTGPNVNLRPEMTTSRELGFEARMFNDRINADFTYFYTHASNQIVNGFRLSYATGFVLNNMNVGTFNTWGWEGHIDGDIIRRPDGLIWNFGINLSHTGSKVVYLPPNVSEYYNPYTWASGNLRNGIMVGHPITTITGLAYMRDTVNQQILISPTTGLPYVNSQWSVLGDRQPKIRFGFNSSLSFKNFRVSTLFAGLLNTTVVNGTKRSMMTSGNSWESVALRESNPVIFNGVLRDGLEYTDNPTKNMIAVDYRIYGAGIYGGSDEEWLENHVNYLRLQELRVSYRLPKKLLANTRIISTAEIFVVGNDLYTWTNYSGIDAVGNAVSAAAGGTGGEGYDVWALPNPRGVTLGLTVTF